MIGIFQRLVIAGALAVAAGPAMSACLTQTGDYDYPKQRLDQALQQFAHTSGCFVTVKPDVLKDKRANALSGHYTPADALVRLVRGTGLEVHVDDGQYAVNTTDQARLTHRIKTLKSRIQRARADGRLSAEQARDFDQQLSAIETGSTELIRQQGFLSAAENASYQRFFNDIHARLGDASN